MTNTNCLEGIQCPACGNEDTFRIEVTTMATVTDDGAEVEHGDIEWDKNSYAQCACCDTYGKLGSFKAQSGAPSEPSEPAPERLSNAKRAAWANAALHLFGQLTGCDREDALGDLLCDLMHWAEQNNFDFGAALERAEGQFEAELLDERPLPPDHPQDSGPNLLAVLEKLVRAATYRVDKRIVDEAREAIAKAKGGAQ